MIPIGGIILWSGSIVSIPANWQICDGSNGTPNLKNRFLVGAGDTYAVDETGGAAEHLHANDFGTHNHGSLSPINVAGSGPASAWDAFAGSTLVGVSGNSDNANGLPPFLALAYIQRLS